MFLCTQKRDPLIERMFTVVMAEGKLKEIRAVDYIIGYRHLAERINELRNQCSVTDVVYTITK